MLIIFYRYEIQTRNKQKSQTMTVIFSFSNLLVYLEALSQPTIYVPIMSPQKAKATQLFTSIKFRVIFELDISQNN